MALSETKARYKRSVLGPLWLTLGFAIGVAGLGLVWGSLLNQSMAEFIPSLTVGLLLWQFISTTVVESSAVFSRQATLIRNVPLPFLIYPAQLVIRQLITFLHNLVVLVVVFAVFPPPLTWGILWAVAGFFLVLLNLLWIAVVVGMLGCRFRDIEQIIPAVMPLIFFLTPVIYKSSHLGANQAVIWLNPFTYFISVVRDPLFGAMPGWHVYAVFLAITFAGWAAAVVLFSTRKNRIPYWV
jgi:ABC-type polysaccharide/polyol phosphate export permease